MRVILLLALLFTATAQATYNRNPDQEQDQRQHQGQEQGQHQGQGQAQGQGQRQEANNEGNHFLAEGDDIDYEVAANKSLLVTSGCQVGSSTDGVKFGISVINQSPACLLLRSSSDALMFAATLKCTSFQESMVKGIHSTPDTSCLRLRSELVNQAIRERNMAVEWVQRDAKHGFVKKLWNKIW